jgi:glycosyltransferase involved in cell wall biosynthesis
MKAGGETVDRVLPRGEESLPTDTLGRLLLVTEQRFDRTPDGVTWTPVDTAAYLSWRRYRAVFREVALLARVRDVKEVPRSWLRVDGAGVGLVPVPYYVGPVWFAIRVPSVVWAAWRATAPHQAVILRGPGMLSSCARLPLRLRRRPYGLEVVGDPLDVFAPGVVEHPLRRVFRWFFTRELRKMCAGASAVAYVTEDRLQSHYPPGPGAFSTWYSDVELPEEAFVDSPRLCLGERRAHSVIFVGSLEQLYKAPDVVIEACWRCREAGLPVELTIVGDGRYRPQLERLCAARDIQASVHFPGWVSDRSKLRQLLDEADLFVLPSRTEGLPRALIEAMARALPCIGANVGGIPELLEPAEMVSPGDASALEVKIRQVLGDPKRMAAMSARNLQKAREFRYEVMQQRSHEMYRALVKATLQTRRGASH